MGWMLLILVDARLKWLDAQVMISITSARTIEKLFTGDTCNSWTSPDYSVGQRTLIHE
jgi:quinol-cytochrome oxidoreductase complex cytochrome b subunit